MLFWGKETLRGLSDESLTLSYVTYYLFGWLNTPQAVSQALCILWSDGLPRSEGNYDSLARG